MESLDLSTHQTYTFETAGTALSKFDAKPYFPMRSWYCYAHYLNNFKMNNLIIISKKEQLLLYLKRYTSRGRLMHKVFLDLIALLNRNFTISHAQFAVILPFLRREFSFRHFNDQKIKEYFADFIRAKTSDFSGKLEAPPSSSISLETFIT